MLIQANIAAPSTVLDFPTRERFVAELRAHRYDTVLMDAYSNLDLLPEQISFLNDFDRLCATKDYNVTFERGTRVAYADRAHHFISG